MNAIFAKYGKIFKVKKEVKGKMKEEIDRLIVKARKLRRKEEFQQAEEESQQALALIKEVLKIVKRLPEEQRVEFCIEWKRYLRIGGKLKKLGDKRKSN